LKRNAKKEMRKKICEKKAAEKGSGGNEFRKYNSRLLLKGKVKFLNFINCRRIRQFQIRTKIGSGQKTQV